MGVKQLRIPLSDLYSAARRQRLADMRALGFEFTVFGFGIPEIAMQQDTQLWHEVSSLISTWEICFPLAEAEIFALKLEAFNKALGDQAHIVFSPLRSKADIVNSGRKYYHVINHGFTLHDDKLAEQLLSLIHI